MTRALSRRKSRRWNGEAHFRALHRKEWTFRWKWNVMSGGEWQQCEWGWKIWYIRGITDRTRVTSDNGPILRGDFLVFRRQKFVCSLWPVYVELYTGRAASAARSPLTQRILFSWNRWHLLPPERDPWLKTKGPFKFIFSDIAFIFNARMV